MPYDIKTPYLKTARQNSKFTPRFFFQEWSQKLKFFPKIISKYYFDNFQNDFQYSYSPKRFPKYISQNYFPKQ